MARCGGRRSRASTFVEAILPGTGSSEHGYLAGVWADPVAERDRAALRVGMPVLADGSFAYRAYLGPIEPNCCAESETICTR